MRKPTRRRGFIGDYIEDDVQEIPFHIIMSDMVKSKRGKKRNSMLK